MPIRLIVADLDGTLLDSAHTVTPQTEQAIRSALARGILFTVATGKTYPSTVRHIQNFDIQIPVICGNGTLVHAPDGTILYEDPIPHDIALEVVQMARARGITPVIYAGRGLLAPEYNGNINVLVAHHEPEPEIVPDLEAAMSNSHKPHKLILIDQDNLDAVAEFQVELEQTFTGRAAVMRTGLASVVEVLPLGVTKGTALAVIQERLGISPEETFAIGDNFNDLDMIQRSGIGVAMGHAPETVRQGADYVTGSNDENGVADAINRLVLETAGDGKG
ncbi:MAG: HAD family hydrolase [Chloroflexi bacterium]|nr:HAD family hydrolase [Chloroflexota bacterium]